MFDGLENIIAIWLLIYTGIILAFGALLGWVIFG